MNANSIFLFEEKIYEILKLITSLFGQKSASVCVNGLQKKHHSHSKTYS